MLLTKGLNATVKHYPNNYAVVDENFHLTYRELYKRIHQLASSLQRMGVKKGDRVGILMANDYRVMEIKYASLMIGAIFVPISTKLSMPETEYILNDSHPNCLFVGEEFVNLVSSFKKTLEIENYVYVADRKDSSLSDVLYYDDLLDKMHEFEVINIHEDDIAGIYYTGGTTGKAKGVMLSHKNLVANVNHTLIHNQYSFNNINLHINPVFHLAGSIPIFIFTTVGATHSFIAKFDPQTILEKVEKLRITHFTMVPSMINMLINHPKVQNFDLTSLETVRYGASPMPLEILEKAYDTLKCNFSANYGMTEASPVLSTLSVDDHLAGFQHDSEHLRKRLKSVGRQITGVEIEIVDRHENAVEPGVIGEIIARGPNIMKGYWCKPKETEEVLREDGWYFTGDMGYCDKDGYIYLVDRKKDMIISGGLNIYSVEVENVIYQSPEVLETVVIGVPDEKWVEAVKAFVVLKSNQYLTEQELLARCRQQLANYKVPKSVEFVESLPKSGSGKILKRELRHQY